MAVKDRSDILRKVQALVDKANSTTFEEEKDLFLKKADELMAVYAIETFELEFAKAAPDRHRKPVMRDVAYAHTGDSEADMELYRVFSDLCSLAGVLIGYYGLRSSKVVGYPEDIDYVELLMTNIVLQMAVNIKPKPSPDLSLSENLAMLKEAGFKWQRVYEELIKVHTLAPQFDKARCDNVSTWHQHGRDCIAVTEGATVLYFDKKIPRPVGVWFTGVYTKFCKDNERERVYSDPEVYKRNFREGFIMGVKRRITEMKMAREAAGTGKEVVLAGMKDALQEALYEFFPDKRPHPAGCECDACHYRRCSNTQCPRTYCSNMRKPMRTRYAAPRYRKTDYAAQAAGAKAGQRVDLSGGRRNVAGNPKGEIE